MAALVLSLCVVLLVAFLGLTVWAAALQRGAQPPPAYWRAMNATHGVWALTLLLGLVSNGGPTSLVRFLEYLALFVGGGVLYTRGLLPNGWLWRVLTDPPRVPRGLLVGSGWNFAAVLGYVFFASGGA